MARPKSSHSAEPVRERSLPLRRVLVGFVVGFLLWLGTVQFVAGIAPWVATDLTYPLFGIFGAWLAVSRMRRALWVACGLVVAAFLVFGYTPLVPWMMHGWVRTDSLEKAQAAVVLGADGDPGIAISGQGQARILHGYEVVKQEYAPILVVSRGASETSWIPAVRRQMDLLGIDVPLQETKRVRNTHDEALAVAEIARQQHWREVILITHPVHMRRAVGVFEKAGLRVIASPCTEWRYDAENPSNMPSRLTAFREWLHEVIGCWVYRRRGWMD